MDISSQLRQRRSGYLDARPPSMMSKNGMAYDTGMPKVASARTPIDVIATYMNSSDTRLNNKGAATDHGGHLSMRHSESAQAHFSPIPQPASAPASLQRKRSNSITHHALSRDSSAEWGWFADIDSSGESFGDNSITSLLRRKFSIDSGGGNEHIIHDEQHSTSRMTAALKTFPGDSGDKVQTAAVSIPKFRIVQSRAGADRHAEYLVTFKLGREFHADWRRYSEFAEIIKKVEVYRFPRAMAAWRNIDNRWFNRLEPSYLHNKCIALEVFLRDLMYELTVPDVLIDFIGERAINCKPLDASGGRPSAQLPKEMRPKQPQEERELFEKLWAENFARSAVNYDESQARPSGSAPV